jgi:hypothetical protein
LGGQLAVLNVIDTQLVPNAMDPRIVAIVQQFRADLLAKQAVFQALAAKLTIQFDTLGPTGFRCGIALPQVP